MCVYGGELQLDKSKFVSQLSLVVQRRERSQVGNSTQHDGAQRHVLEIPARKNRDNCQTRMHTIRKKPSTDATGLGRWCSWPFYANPNHVTRIVVAYRPCPSRSKGLKTVYQQHLRYMQRNGVSGTPIQMFDRDLTEQIKS